MKRFVVLLLAALLFVSCEKKSADKSGIVIYSYDGNEEEVLLQNNYLELRFIPKTAEVLLREKATGMVWRSNPENAANDTGADTVTKQLMLSQFSLLYADEAMAMS
ncbi:hypothetical protein FACS189479_09150 [Spirochaetia bacterium]|nr:hypothetical protein FACS189479_09150 [Spirochaetia bacterium]